MIQIFIFFMLTHLLKCQIIYKNMYVLKCQVLKRTQKSQVTKMKITKTKKINDISRLKVKTIILIIKILTFYHKC